MEEKREKVSEGRWGQQGGQSQEAERRDTQTHKQKTGERGKETAQGTRQKRMRAGERLGFLLGGAVS